MSRTSFLFVYTFVCTISYTAVAQTATSVTYEYANVKFPGARITNANGINNSNVIVGSYFDSQDFVHGFVYRNGKFSAINVPGATETQVLGINDKGEMVGMYQYPGALNFHGFLRQNGSFISIDDPTAQFGTMAFGINDSGTIVGSFDNAKGFVYSNGTYRTLDAPQLPGEPHQTQLNGINNLGWIVGQVFTGGIWRGFWIVNNKLHFAERLGSIDSQATGINGHEDLVGCHDAQAGFVSFAIENAGAAFPSEQPLASCVSAINYFRAVVGNYFTATNANGFLAVPVLTLQVSRPINGSSLYSPVHVVASANGTHPVSQIQVWVNYKEMFHVAGGNLNVELKLKAGTNERFVVQAIDSKGIVAKVVESITVR